ncbi:MAG: hypothetical protein M2R45_00355 [Verrucomicrobia subdivision 3 bacterium]|nr:hypothetical protein [Limisphaerales bacterium]MCS1412887.1 hypothetical protein [Limisphaerales bacterium]
MQKAFKEWTVVVDALARGEQILILRKGGIREGKAGFQILADRFWLFPTQFHQQREAVIETAQQRFDEIHMRSNTEETIAIQFMAELVESHEIEDWGRVARLNGQQIWREDVIRERFEWGQKKAISAMIVRVFRLEHPFSVAMTGKYGGCRSWINLEMSLPTDGLTPVLTKAEFENRLAQFREVVA